MLLLTPFKSFDCCDLILSGNDTKKKNIWEQTLKVRKIESLKYEECEMKVTGYFLVECCEFFYLRKTDKKIYV